MQKLKWVEVAFLTFMLQSVNSISATALVCVSGIDTQVQSGWHQQHRDWLIPWPWQDQR